MRLCCDASEGVVGFAASRSWQGQVCCSSRRLLRRHRCSPWGGGRRRVARSTDQVIVVRAGGAPSQVRDSCAPPARGRTLRNARTRPRTSSSLPSAEAGTTLAGNVATVWPAERRRMGRARREDDGGSRLTPERPAYGSQWDLRPNGAAPFGINRAGAWAHPGSTGIESPSWTPATWSTPTSPGGSFPATTSSAIRGSPTTAAAATRMRTTR